MSSGKVGWNCTPSFGMFSVTSMTFTFSITSESGCAEAWPRALTISSSPSLPYRADDMEVTLAPGKGVEVKTHLAKGSTLIYTWKTKNSEKVNHDFHGEPVNAKENEFESFILEKAVSESRGTLIAPFTGVHGWYWKNKSAAPVTVVLRASGFYSDIYKK